MSYSSIVVPRACPCGGGGRNYSRAGETVARSAPGDTLPRDFVSACLPPTPLHRCIGLRARSLNDPHDARETPDHPRPVQHGGGVDGGYSQDAVELCQCVRAALGFRVVPCASAGPKRTQLMQAVGIIPLACQFSDRLGDRVGVNRRSGAILKYRRHQAGTTVSRCHDVPRLIA